MTEKNFNWAIIQNRYPTNSNPAFICPHCNLKSAHSWEYGFQETLKKIETSELFDDNLNYPRYLIQSTCLSCNERAIWHKDSTTEEILYPIYIENIVEPNLDMPEHVRKTYTEASTILNDSPRAATALARLALEELLTSLEVKGKNINEQIGNLVQLGLSVKVQKALDALRVIGNNAIHPGKIENLDNADSAKSILELLNFIVEELITKPKEIESIYASLPEGVLDAIEKRDSK